MAVPALHFTVVAQHNVLNLLFNLLRILFIFDQIADVQDSLVGVGLDLLASGDACPSLGAVLLSLTFLGGDRRGRSHVDNSVDHTIFFEGALVGRSILKSEDAEALLVVLRPVALILATVRVVERTLSVAQAIGPVTDIAVAEQLERSAVIEPDVRAEARLHIVEPVTRILLVAGDPIHRAVPIALVVVPVSFVKVP